MKHNIRINGEVKELDCQLGSGVLDVNGREILEGHKVKNEYGDCGYVFLQKGNFCFKRFRDNIIVRLDYYFGLEIVDD